MKILLILPLLIGLMACTKEETKDSLKGKWFLVHANGGIAGINQAFPKGDIVWTFDNSVLSIDNIFSGQWNVSPPTMKKNYNVVSTKERDELHLGGEYFVDFKMSGDSLFLSQQKISDGFDFVLVR